ncbi:hypothetical protein [Methylocaldum sp.]|uniref:hypothetical protein n=1 Tax=Methylocaldum sp. TaxID=1969727 RepID=UPI002D6E7A4E|nr:hypothetical protein [Methylocaldum sp.]HYE34035.1 hypothetical protein [Methylocaldum sp.]
MKEMKPGLLLVCLWLAFGQGVMILKHGQIHHRAASHRFYDFLSSPMARAIFTRLGHLLP